MSYLHTHFWMDGYDEVIAREVWAFVTQYGDAKAVVAGPVGGEFLDAVFDAMLKIHGASPLLKFGFAVRGGSPMRRFDLRGHEGGIFAAFRPWESGGEVEALAGVMGHHVLMVVQSGPGGALRGELPLVVAGCLATAKVGRLITFCLEEHDFDHAGRPRAK